MKWFGKRELRFQEQEDEAPTPVGEACSWCGEPIAAGDDGVIIPYLEASDKPLQYRPAHLECHLRVVVGSVEHQEQRCTCFGGTAEEPHTRAAAKAAVALYQRSIRRGGDDEDRDRDR